MCVIRNNRCSWKQKWFSGRVEILSCTYVGTKLTLNTTRVVHIETVAMFQKTFYVFLRTTNSNCMNYMLQILFSDALATCKFVC